MAHESGGTQALLELCHRSRVEAAEFGAALPKPLSGHDAWRDLSLKPHLCGGLEETDDSVPQRRVWMYMSNCALWAAETQKLQVKPGAKLIQWCRFSQESLYMEIDMNGMISQGHMQYYMR